MPVLGYVGIGPHDLYGGEHDAVRCWLGLGSNDPLRCGSSSAHPTLAMHNLLQFANSLRGCTMLLLHSLATPHSTLQTPCRPVALCNGWVGWGTKVSSMLVTKCAEVCAQVCTRLPHLPNGDAELCTSVCTTVRNR